MKQELKDNIFRKRNSLTKTEAEQKSIRIKENLLSLDEFKRSENIMFYISFNNEVDTQNFIKELLRNKGKNIIVPFVVKGESILQLSEIKNFDDLEPKTFGILEPKENKILKFNPDNLDLIIVPGIAFDRNGNRIGYGHGYYDRFFKNLKKNVKKIGLAYDFQLVDKIIPHEFDIPMDLIITESRVINCKH
jgi:5-formyltetrahydrofolate cyclo-ligase